MIVLCVHALQTPGASAVLALEEFHAKAYDGCAQNANFCLPALDEIHAGSYDGCTYAQIANTSPGTQCRLCLLPVGKLCCWLLLAPPGFSQSKEETYNLQTACFCHNGVPNAWQLSKSRLLVHTLAMNVPQRIGVRGTADGQAALQVGEVAGIKLAGCSGIGASVVSSKGIGLCAGVDFAEDAGAENGWLSVSTGGGYGADANTSPQLLLGNPWTSPGASHHRAGAREGVCLHCWPSSGAACAVWLLCGSALAGRVCIFLAGMYLLCKKATRPVHHCQCNGCLSSQATFGKPLKARLLG
eukprot:scaffold52441_cov18-Tisochrysis_lutea.AAC.5